MSLARLCSTRLPSEPVRSDPSVPTVLALRPATRLVGRAVDEVGRGRAGARVTLFVLPRRSEREERTATVATEPNGRLSLWLDPAHKAFRVRVEADGAVPGRWWLPQGTLGRPGMA